MRDSENVQKDLNIIYKWKEENLMEFKEEKFKQVMEQLTI